MTIRVKDKNRAELVKAIIRQNGGKIFTVIAKRKTPKRYFIIGKFLNGTTAASYTSNGKTTEIKEGDKFYLDTKKNKQLLQAIKESESCEFTEHTEYFMTMTCRTGVKKDLKGGQSTIAHKDDLISVNLTNGKGYRAFSAYNVLELRASGTVIQFKEEDVLSFEGE
ncbi:hypothetical protein RJ80_gp07 [Vibrio phage phi-A318]|uniref:Uncharacterized protein n=2 Tax=Kaohsiungvirus TaxID=2731674 RepID=A0A067YI87_9CAUD|nr:hypothetical protein RJ80_gp07 [Vibrio phage phi-A318]YP_009783875.1 hypothetical protein HOQ87_gp07 [Vibrio phage AS51]AGZ17780.1 hypothetical protein [Vibrio phage phi-A318]AHC94051.1 hypothetical protein [Vibrio phage AS51]